MILLDSNIIIYLSKEMYSYEDILEDNEQYSISVITYMEVLAYPFESDREKRFIEKLLKLFHIYYIDFEIVQKVIELKQSHKIKLPDAIICATAICNNSVLMTNDIRLKSISALKIQTAQSI